MKNRYRGVDCLKRGAWTVWRFGRGGGGERGLARNRGGVFEGGLMVDGPMHTMVFN